MDRKCYAIRFTYISDEFLNKVGYLIKGGYVEFNSKYLHYSNCYTKKGTAKGVATKYNKSRYNIGKDKCIHDVVEIAC